MNATLFYVFGLALVVSAVAVALIGLRFERFPPNRAALAGMIAYFAVLVAGTTTFAVLHAADEQHDRESEQAAAATEAQASGATTTTGATNPATVPGVSPSGGGSTTSPSGGKGGGASGAGSTVRLSAASDTIAYTTTKLSARSGQVTIAFDNPSTLTHDVCLESKGSTQLGCSDQIAQATASLSKPLKPGTYTFYCSVDAHRQAGMEGTLTVK